MNLKIERLESTFVKEISRILMEEVKDEDIKFVTITDCDITNDLSYAKVYFTVLDMTRKADTIKALNHAKSFIRGQLSKRVEMRHTPELTFIFDESIEYGKQFDNIIDKINEEEK